MTLTLWHNPRCSKSRQTLALLEERGLNPEIRRYLDNPPTVEELENALRSLKRRPIDITRTGETRFKELGLSKESADADLIAALASHPILIERPILFNEEKAAIGRPPENVLSIL